MTAPGQFCFAHASVYPVPHLRVHDPGLWYYTVILLMVWKDFIHFYNEFYTRLLNYKGVLMISEMCAVIASNFKQLSVTMCRAIWPLIIWYSAERNFLFPGGGGHIQAFIWQGCSSKIKCQIPQKIELLKIQTLQKLNNRKFIAPKMVLKDSFPCYLKMLYSRFS